MSEGNQTALGIYVHVPYCIKKCRYCDFTSFEEAPRDCYFDGLAESIRSAAEKLGSGEVYGTINAVNLFECSDRSRIPVDSVFFGGGTPSLASAVQLGTVLRAVQDHFLLTEDAELTIEVNPETVTAEKAAELKELGFNRVSIGVQSFDDRVLKALGRVHSADRAREAFKTLRAAGFENINLDLMLGVPMASDDPESKQSGQSFDSWESTLEEALALRPEHLSFYSLQIEEGTPLYRDFAAGRVDISSWEDNRRMYHLAVELLKKNGYHHYEVSNAALPGFECRHNLKYWTMRPYLGFGTSAHSFILVFSADGRIRAAFRGEAAWRNTEHTVCNRNPSEAEFCSLKPESTSDLKGDFIFTQLRLTAGLDTDLYRKLFGSDFSDDLKDEISRLTEEGYAEMSGVRLRLTPKGLDNTNPVMQCLLSGL